MTQTPETPETPEIPEPGGPVHPALRRGAGPTMPAGKVIVVLVVALLVAGLLNSAWMVRTAEGMPEGWSRSAVLGLATGVDAVASRLSLDRPRAGLDVLLGREQLTGGDELVSGDDAILAGTARVPLGERAGQGAPPALRRATSDEPLRVLVLGDSLATYVGQQLDEHLAPTGRVEVTTQWRNGTGLATPSFFNWQAYAVDEVQDERPEAVVVVLGGNDDQEMRRGGTIYRRGTDAWQTEYARRVAVVMKAMVDAGVQRVYWSGPPTTRNSVDNGLNSRLNQAVARAARVIPGARFVDLFHGTAVDGEYAEYVTIDGERVDARQSDALHWTWRGAVQPMRLVLAALEADWGPLD
jgi:hypothetical protein